MYIEWQTQTKLSLTSEYNSPTRLIMDRLEDRNRASEIEFKKRSHFALVKTTLVAVKSMEGFEGSANMKDAVLKRALYYATLALPSHVSYLDLGDGAVFERTPDQLKNIPEEQRQGWDLKKLDLYAAELAQSLNMDWTPFYPSNLN